MSGLTLLYKLLLKDAAKGSGKASGILSIGSDIRKIAMNKHAKYVESAKKQGVDLDKLSEQEIKYMLEMNKPKGPTLFGHRVIDATSAEGKGITEALLGKKPADVLDLTGKKIDTSKPILGGKNVPEDVVTETIIEIKRMEPMDAMKEANKILKGDGRYKSLSKADRKKIVDDESVTDHIFERNIEPDPEDLAHGGRTGTGLNYLLGEDDQNVRMPYVKGKLVDAGRRLFLQAMGAGAAGITAAKTGLFGLLKGGGKKAVIKELTQVPIKTGVDGMPVWFKPLVNKVIKEGDDVTKKLATKEREIVHTKKLDEFDEVTVTQDLDTGNVRVQYNTSNSTGEYGVDLNYKAAEEIPLKGKKGSVKTKEEFSAVESEPEIVNWDGDIEWSGENVVNKVDDLLTDTTKLETYATGKKPNIKKLLESEKKTKYVNKLNEDQMEQINFIESKHGPGPDPSDFVKESSETIIKKASGGRVSLSAGGLAGLLGE